MKNRKLNYRIFTWILVLCLVLLFFSCSSKSGNRNSQKLKILATTTIVGDIVSNVVGNRTDVEILLPVGMSAHSYEPTPRDIAKVSQADILFINGAGLEQFLDKIIENSGSSAKIISLSEYLKLRQFENSEQSQDSIKNTTHQYDKQGDDPHVWTNPINIIESLPDIVEILSDLDAENADGYALNSENYRQKLFEFDEWIKDQIKLIPLQNRKIVTDHLVFGYFCDRYGLEQVGAIIPGFNTLSEPSAKEIARLEDTISQFRIKAIFVGNTVNQLLADRIANDTGIKLIPIYTGSLGKKGGEADTYLKYMRYNVRAIVAALK